MIRAKVLPALSKACMCHAEYKKNLFRRHFSPDAHILSQTGAALTSSATQISARRPGDLFYHQVNMTPPWYIYQEQPVSDFTSGAWPRNGLRYATQQLHLGQPCM